MHDEFQRHGVDVTLIALDTPAAAEPWLAPLRDNGPRALIDETLATAEAFGWINVPSAICYDAGGAIVRGPDIAFIRPKRAQPVPDGATPEQREMIGFINAFPNDAERWLAALRDWVARGSASPFALSPSEVVARSRAYGPGRAQASAHYALADQLRRLGHEHSAAHHYATAFGLDPELFTRKRQAWSLMGGPERFGSSFGAEMRAFGPERFYPANAAPFE